MGSGTLLDLLARSGSDAIWLPETDVRISYARLRDQTVALAGALAGMGIERGARIATFLPNGLAAVTGFLAAALAGTAAPLNPAYREDEVRFYLDDTGARILLCQREGSEEACRAARSLGIPVCFLEPDPSGEIRIAGAPPPRGFHPPGPEDIALVLHTSGSTGRPKRVPLSHANLMASLANIAAHYALSPSDVSLCIMPLYHVHGLVASTLATLHSGGTVVIPAQFNLLNFWKTAARCRATWYSAVPTLHGLLLDRAGGRRPAGAERLRFIRSCSAPLPAAMMERLEAVFGVPVLEAYGMTEASHQMCSSPAPPAARKPGSVGVATGLAVAVMDDGGALLPAGATGEVVIQGPTVTRGYENNPEANAASFTNGWFRTGDQGVLDEEGYLHLTGRLKELINRGGEKIGPREIDEVLLAHPAVAEAVCFGAPHPSWGEEVEAAVVLKPGSEASETELLAFCHSRLAAFKCPKRLHFPAKISRTGTGKIQRSAVAEQCRS